MSELRVRIKVCGITEERGLEAAVSCGVDAVGFVFAKSVRRVSRNGVKGLIRGLPPFVTPVAVFKDNPDDVFGVIDRLPVTHVQIDAEVLEDSDLREARELNLMPVYRTGSEAMAWLLEDGGKASGACVVEGSVSGAGRVCDWSEASRVSAQRRVILAGGLTPENVGDAIRAVRPYGVDVSSGVESAPGVKDPERMMAFVKAVREAERSLG